MNELNGDGVATALVPAHTSTAARPRRLVRAGVMATAIAMIATTIVGALVRATGVDFELPEGGTPIPWYGFGGLTGAFSVVGVVIAAALLRWSARPAERFVQTAVTLTAISLVPPFLVDADAGTVAGLVLLHLVAAAVMIPALARELRS